jgi:hypothetical protein
LKTGLSVGCAVVTNDIAYMKSRGNYMAKKRKAKKTKKTKMKRKGTAKKNRPKKQWFTPKVKKWSTPKDDNNIEL